MSPKLQRKDSLVKVVKHDKDKLFNDTKVGFKSTKNSHAKSITLNHDVRSNSSV